jgi:hypothetical protein
LLCAEAPNKLTVILSCPDQIINSFLKKSPRRANPCGKGALPHGNALSARLRFACSRRGSKPAAHAGSDALFTSSASGPGAPRPLPPL